MLERLFVEVDMFSVSLFLIGKRKKKQYSLILSAMVLIL